MRRRINHQTIIKSVPPVSHCANNKKALEMRAL